MIFKKISSSWENMCLKCGLCCHEKVIIGDNVIYDLDSYCQHFDIKTKECKIYFERLEKESRCRRVNLFRAMFAPYLPESCAYVQWARKKHLRFAPKRHIHFTHQDRGSGQDDDADDLLYVQK